MKVSLTTHTVNFRGKRSHISGQVVIMYKNIYLLSIKGHDKGFHGYMILYWQHSIIYFDSEMWCLLKTSEQVTICFQKMCFFPGWAFQPTDWPDANTKSNFVESEHTFLALIAHHLLTEDFASSLLMTPKSFVS